MIPPNKVELTCEQVARPVHVRYAWANNPVCNLSSNEGLPVTPFRTDDFEMVTKPKPIEVKAALPANGKAKKEKKAAKPKATDAKPAAKKAPRAGPVKKRGSDS